MQVSECNLRVDLYASGGWRGIQANERRLLLNYGEDFRRQLQPMTRLAVNHGGYISSCLVHCVSGYAFWVNARIAGISPSEAFLSW